MGDASDLYHNTVDALKVCQKMDILIQNLKTKETLKKNFGNKFINQNFFKFLKIF